MRRVNLCDLSVMIHCMPLHLSELVLLCCIATYFCLTNVILDPIPMAAVVGVTLAILIIFLVLVIALLIAYKKEKMCFKSEYNILNTCIHHWHLYYGMNF